MLVLTMEFQFKKYLIDWLLIDQCTDCNEDGKTDFFCNSGYTEMLSGITNNYDYRHLQRLERENAQMGSTTEIINKLKNETYLDYIFLI